MAKTPQKPNPFDELDGFDEAPQPALTGVPLKGGIADWAAQLEREALEEVRKNRKEETRQIRSSAGLHRVRVDIAAQKAKAEPVEAKSTKSLRRWHQAHRRWHIDWRYQ
jgi:excinuclease ABC subunit B